MNAINRHRPRPPQGRKEITFAVSPQEWRILAGLIAREAANAAALARSSEADDAAIGRDASLAHLERAIHAAAQKAEIYG